MCLPKDFWPELYLQEGEEHKCIEPKYLYCKEDHIIGDKWKCKEYTKELDTMNKMMEEKCDVYKANDIRGYRRGKTYAAAA